MGKPIIYTFATICSVILLVPSSLGAQQVVSGCEGEGANKSSTHERVYTAQEVTRKAVIKERPPPSYTEEAKKNNVEGTVVLRVTLAGSGKVTCVKSIRRLPDGLTDEAIKVVRKIKFVPAEKDGRRVSMWVRVEYNFSLF